MAEWQKRWNTLVGKLEVVADATAAQRLLDRLTAPQAPTVLGFVNAHAMNLVVRDGACHQALSAADVLLRDGSGMAILYRRLGLEPGLNMNGTDFIPRLLAAYRGRRVAFWGTRQPYLDQAVQRSATRFGVVPVSVHDGFASVDTYLQLASELQPELIVLGMGMPRQEVVAARLAATGAPCLIVCGGAILDFLGGKVSRAPVWLRRLGGEWLYRLLREPKRLFMRYVVGNPLFLLRTLLYRRDGGAARHPV
ncbi:MULTISPECIES: WecB/TagA/CpsF family glycosyltransferase [Pseudomonas]|uniref:WecB/TagA/CpsF family glycosyltransferase n=1 Tax=Pseudomonas pudica TaxID=272772 RepID=A0ABS0G3F6_9PSED|nr:MULTISPECIES: WecB/TagA/CpsF family glycosyltransferase [Pseudomonas]KKO16597.1 glycosyl transferase [Pseudomonas putida KG-4]MBF8647057.1 WecB/TagA/CpsF family glycosyltransferase [Pseudomonas pudica]MBF8708887.1 WecB/TagA/CpsF family glycosyltransferase [Pseudomonas putida]MBF8760700.1 WecB/TagA/CpsF family glycosyltransferase [Pseudomonas pudica]MDZ5110968.1 WecB/TagA/CpsF family glycosyltransferase [Pseudomonas putida]